MAVAIIVVLVTLGSVVFHFWSPWWFTPLASNWSSMDDVLIITFWVTGVVFVAVCLFLAYCLWRYRGREGNKAEYQPESKKLETWLTVLTTVGVVAMLAPGLLAWDDFVTVPDDHSVIDVFAEQWMWNFRFPGKDGELGKTGIKYVSYENPLGVDPEDPKGWDDVVVESAESDNEVHIPLNVTLKVELRSKDVLHNFYVPQFRAKMDMVPGLVTYFWFTPTRPGTYDILCAELCGVGHYTMRGKVVVEEQADFDVWLAGYPTFADTMPEAAAGPESAMELENG